MGRISSMNLRYVFERFDEFVLPGVECRGRHA